jgi:hypothetical protein
MNNSAKACLLLLATLLSACGNKDDAAAPVAAEPAATPVTPVAAPVQPAEVVPAPTAAKLWFEPAGLSACTKKADKVVVYWDASEVPGIKKVEVKLPGAAGTERLFVRGDLTGSRETGMWMVAGREVILRNAAGGAEIARAAIGSIPCNQ